VSEKRGKILILMVVLAALISLSLIVFFAIRLGPRVERRGGGPKGGDGAPDFALSTLKGDSVRLADLRGKVVFLNFWATWCPPCREEMPFMVALYQRLKERRFEMLAVSIDTKGEAAVGPFVEKYALPFPVLLDPDSKIYKLYGLTGIPETFIIDQNGVIHMKIIGPQNWMKQEWLDTFDRLAG
jgi:peroxiredoxin